MERNASLSNRNASKRFGGERDCGFHDGNLSWAVGTLGLRQFVLGKF